MKLSIVTIVLNDPHGLDRTLSSIFKNSCNDYELIIVNGGHDVETNNIINKFMCSKMTVINEKDEGVYDAMNKGINAAKGSIISFLNAGDTAKTNYVGDFIDAIQSYDYVYSGVNLVTKKNKIITNYPKDIELQNDYIQRMPFSHPGLAVRSYCFKELGLFDLSKKRTADHLWIISLIKSNFKGVNCKFANVYFYLGGTSMSISSINEMYHTARGFKRSILLSILYYLYGLCILIYYRIYNL